ncbi:hypothetical protein AB0469_17535 [Streptomyces sp. NPDC093801]
MCQNLAVMAEDPSVRAKAIHGPSIELLDRALAGWERFLDTFEEVPDE